MSNDNRQVDINYGQPTSDLIREAMRQAVQQPDFTGIGGHDVQDHGGHGPHSQVSIGLGNTTVNFREAQDSN